MAKDGIIKTVANKAEKIAANHKKKKTIKQIKTEEAALKNAKEEADQIFAEKQLIQAEKDRLMNMSQQELLAEAIMAIRGFYKEFEDLKIQQNELKNRIDILESDVSDLEYTDEDSEVEEKLNQLQSAIEHLQNELSTK